MYARRIMLWAVRVYSFFLSSFFVERVGEKRRTRCGEFCFGGVKWKCHADENFSRRNETWLNRVAIPILIAAGGVYGIRTMSIHRVDCGYMQIYGNILETFACDQHFK